MFILCVTILVTVLDQITKEVVRHKLATGELSTVIPGFFNIAHVHNTGAAWGMLEGLSQGLVVLSIVMLVVLAVFRRHFIKDDLWSRLALGLMMGGIVGNLIDRVRLGYVVDFLDFHWKELCRFPSFNVADSAICVGVGLYILLQLLEKPEKPDADDAEIPAQSPA